jgi:hypothetical protein
MPRLVQRETVGTRCALQGVPAISRRHRGAVLVVVLQEMRCLEDAACACSVLVCLAGGLRDGTLEYGFLVGRSGRRDVPRSRLAELGVSQHVHAHPAIEELAVINMMPTEV